MFESAAERRRPAPPFEKMTVLITGAGRGIGLAFVEYLTRRGVRRIYAAGRDLEALGAVAERASGVVVPLRLDVTDADSIAAAALYAPDVNVLVNNAGIARRGSIIASGDGSDARAEMETNYFGLLAMCRAFAPALRANAPGAVVNVLSILGLIGIPAVATYGASKAAALAATRALRAELANDGVAVVAVLPGYVDTAMTDGLRVPKIAPLDVAAAALDAVLDGSEDVYPGEVARSMVEDYFRDHKELEHRLAGR